MKNNYLGWKEYSYSHPLFITINRGCNKYIVLDLLSNDVKIA